MLRIRKQQFYKMGFTSPGVNSRDYDLKSYGRDGEDGGAEDDADIESWNLDV